MNSFRHIALILLVLSSFTGFSQSKTAASPSASTASNKKDAKGKPDGIWWIHEPAKMGEDAYYAYGSYDHGRKYGLWYKLNENGELLAIENFKNDMLHGEVKYYDQGRLYCTGNYLGLNPAHAFDTVLVVDPVTGNEHFVPVATERGSVRHGTWKFYDPQTGRLIREEEYQVDELIKKNEMLLTAADSAKMKQRAQLLPQNQRTNYQPPPGKRHSYTNYK